MVILISILSIYPTCNVTSETGAFMLQINRSLRDKNVRSVLPDRNHELRTESGALVSSVIYVFECAALGGK